MTTDFYANIVFCDSKSICKSFFSRKYSIAETGFHSQLAMQINGFLARSLIAHFYSITLSGLALPALIIHH